MLSAQHVSGQRPDGSVCRRRDCRLSPDWSLLTQHPPPAACLKKIARALGCAGEAPTPARRLQPVLGLTWADTGSESGHHPDVRPRAPPPRAHPEEAFLPLADVMARHHGSRPHGGGLAAPFIGDNTTDLAIYY